MFVNPDIGRDVHRKHEHDDERDKEDDD